MSPVTPPRATRTRPTRNANGFGQSYLRPIVGAPRTASLGGSCCVAERAFAKQGLGAWQKAYHYRQSLACLCFLCRKFRKIRTPQKSVPVRVRGFASRAKEARQAHFNCCRLGILPCFILFFAGALIVRGSECPTNTCCSTR